MSGERTSRGRARPRVVVALAAVLSFVPLPAACSGGSSDEASPGSAPPGTPALTDLQSVDQFRALFNADKGTPRLLLLLSPT